MNFTGQATLPVSQAQAWAALTDDPALLQASLSGCESLRRTGVHAFEALLTLPIGTAQERFKLQLQFAELQAPNSFSLAFEASTNSGDGGGQGRAQLRLEAQGPAQTLLKYELRASVGGKLAELDAHLLDRAVQQSAHAFFDALNKARQAAAPHKSRLQRLLDWYLGWLGKVFTGKV